MRLGDEARVNAKGQMAKESRAHPPRRREKQLEPQKPADSWWRHLKLSYLIQMEKWVLF